MAICSNVIFVAALSLISCKVISLSAESCWLMPLALWRSLWDRKKGEKRMQKEEKLEKERDKEKKKI